MMRRMGVSEELIKELGEGVFRSGHLDEKSRNTLIFAFHAAAAPGS